MILRLLNMSFISIILPMLTVYPSTYLYSAQKSPAHYYEMNTDIHELPDLGNLSNFDNVFDFAADRGGEKQLYLYTLAVRLNAIRNILTVTKITRGIGEYLEIEDGTLKELPSELTLFDRDRFPDLYKIIDSISDGSFNVAPEAFEETLDKLAEKTPMILNVKGKILAKNVLERENIKNDLTEKIPAEISIPLYLPNGSPSLLVYTRDLKLPLGFKRGKKIIGIARTLESRAYDTQKGLLEAQLEKSKQIMDSITDDLYLYLPFYDQNLFQKTWSSLRGNLKPSYTFADLLVATVFFDLRPDLQVKTPAEFAKWLSSGVKNRAEYNKFLFFYDKTMALREDINKGGAFKVLDSAKIAFKTALQESIKNQNEALKILADGSNVVNNLADPKSCHVKTQDYSKLPRQFSFLVNFSGLKRQFADVYGKSHISQDRLNILSRDLEILCEKGLKSKERPWLVPVRIAVITAAVMIPAGWICLAIIAGYSVLDAGTAWGVSLKTQAETKTLMSIFDSANLFSEDSPNSLPVNKYRSIVEFNDSFKMEAYYTTAEIPLYIALYWGISKVVNISLAKKPAIALKKVLSLSREPIAPLKAGMVLASAAVLVAVQINQATGIEDPSLILDDKKAKAYSSDITFNARRTMLKEHFSDLDADADELGLVSSFAEGSTEIRLFDLAGTRTFDKDGKTEIFINYRYFTDTDTSFENLVYEIAYYYYLQRTTDLIMRQGLLDDLKYRVFKRVLAVGKKKNDETIRDQTSVEESLSNATENAVKEGIFLSADEYAKGLGGIPDTHRDYQGREFLLGSN